MKPKIRYNTKGKLYLLLVSFFSCSFVLKAQELQLEIPTHHQEGLTALVLPNGSNLIYSGGKEGAIVGWDKVNGKKIHAYTGHSGSVEVLKNHGHQLISAGREQDIFLWNLNDQEIYHKLTGHKYYVESLDIHQASGCLVSGSRDNTIKIWDLATGKQIAYLNGHEDNVLSVAVHPDNKLIASSAERHNLKVWDVSKQEVVIEMTGDLDIHHLAFSPDGQYLLGVIDKKILVWEVGSWEVKYHLRGHIASIEGITFRPGSSILTSIDQAGKVIFWDILSGRLLRSFVPGPTFLTALAFDDQGKELALGFENGLIQLWNIEVLDQ